MEEETVHVPGLGASFVAHRGLGSGADSEATRKLAPQHDPHASERQGHSTRFRRGLRFLLICWQSSSWRPLVS